MKILYLIITLLFYSCCNNNTKQMNKHNYGFRTDSKVIIFKTKSDFYYNVPIIISDNKNEIISYPHPSDLTIEKKLRLPIKLINGFLLDNRGISKNIAFIKLTYEDYSKLNQPPSLLDLKEMILDDDPILEIYDCGFFSDYDDLVKDLNTIISQNEFHKFMKIK